MKKILTILFLAIQFYTFGQDKIILNNKKVIDGKILEVGLNEIKYKPSDNLEGPEYSICLLYTSPSPRDRTRSRMPSSA